ncbi:hypothetical protein J2X97_000352 [Epilithonimonas hungarica]|uniref:hypothetical protein n=1 Tax=Epilithonimonas hungarica TaxID=454006 RepID=UPI00277D9114|nr:hypothetical protein [Epilithonimonas hungarica]MDP9954715.1 hypothetical protein [Epilithonimonas hungarica]
MENTLKNKSKFFAQYWGQRNILSPLHRNPEPFASHNLTTEYLKDYVLQLKHLLTISNEELITAIKILDTNDEFTELGSLQIGREIIQIVDDINSEVARNDIHPQYIFYFADYLRSKGYALPWMGLSVEKLVEYGWVKLKTE